VHYYQRPDDDVFYDSTRTRLSGVSTGLGLSKSGGITRFHTGVWYKSPGLEVNDVGYMQSVNSMGQSNWFAFVFTEPKAFYRRLQVNFNQWNNWFTDGTSTGHGGNINMNSTFKNMWSAYMGIGGETGSHCGSCLRGGPAMWEQPNVSGWAGFYADNRKPVVPGANFNFNRGDGGHSHQYSGGPFVDIRVASRFSASLGVNYARNVADRQWYANYGDVASDTTHHTVARLEQKTVSVTTRMNWTASPTLSLQLYAQPFTTGGDYSNWRRVSDPHNRTYANQFTPFTDQGSDPGGFNFKQFRSNAVLRWEYRPGSTLFLVWQQGRTQDGVDAGTFAWSRDYRKLFSAHPENTLLVKASYWFSL
jgi:hypothetical protein